MTEQRSKIRKSQSFYTPCQPLNPKKNHSIDQNNESSEFSLLTETRGIKKKIEFELEMKKNDVIEKAFRDFKAQPIPNYTEMVNLILQRF